MKLCFIFVTILVVAGAQVPAKPADSTDREYHVKILTNMIADRFLMELHPDNSTQFEAVIPQTNGVATAAPAITAATAAAKTVEAEEEDEEEE